VFKLAWALPSQMAKVGWVNPVIGNVGDVKTATVQVTDNGVDRNGVFGTPRPVRGATVTFQVTSGSPLPGEPVKVLTGADGLASVNWPFTPAGGLELRASGFGIGLTVVEGGTGPFADHFTNEVPLDTGRLFFRGFACGAGDPTLGLTSATVDGKIGPGEYQNAEMHTFPVSLGGNNSSTGTLYIGNDCQNLYLAFVVGVDESTNNSLRFVFDNTPPQGESADDDILSLSKVSVGSWMFRDRFLSQACVGSKQADCGPDDVSAGGTSDGAGAASFDVGIGKFVYEFRHPLKSGDASHDFQRAFGQSVGYYLAVSLGTGSKGNTEWPDQKGNFKNYQTYVVRGPTLMP
jgi:hypothetical protein